MARMEVEDRVPCVLRTGGVEPEFGTGEFASDVFAQAAVGGTGDLSDQQSRVIVHFDPHAVRITGHGRRISSRRASVSEVQTSAVSALPSVRALSVVSSLPAEVGPTSTRTGKTFAEAVNGHVATPAL